MGSQRLQKDHTSLWALPSPSWVQLYQRPWAMGSEVSQTRPPYLLKPPKCPGLDHTPCTSLQIGILCAWRKAWRRCPGFTGPPLGGGTAGEEEGRSFSDSLCFLQQTDIDHICNLKHQYLQPAQQLHSQVYT